MKDMQRMMKEAQKMAAEMAKAQESLGDIEVQGTAGGGAVKVTASADLHITSITISPDAFDGPPDADDIEILGDTVTAAVNDALDKARAEQEKVMGPIAGGMGGLGLPGM